MCEVFYKTLLPEVTQAECRILIPHKNLSEGNDCYCAILEFTPPLYRVCDIVEPTKRLITSDSLRREFLICAKSKFCTPLLGIGGQASCVKFGVEEREIVSKLVRE